MNNREIVCERVVEKETERERERERKRERGGGIKEKFKLKTEGQRGCRGRNQLKTNRERKR